MKIIEHKQLKIDEELINLCARIYAEGKTDEEWAQIESDDMFQSQKYCGGYDASEQSFGLVILTQVEKSGGLKLYWNH